jgi:hypothetical protein
VFNTIAGFSKANIVMVLMETKSIVVIIRLGPEKQARSIHHYPLELNNHLLLHHRPVPLPSAGVEKPSTSQQTTYPDGSTPDANGKCPSSPLGKLGGSTSNDNNPPSDHHKSKHSGDSGGGNNNNK